MNEIVIELGNGIGPHEEIIAKASSKVVGVKAAEKGVGLLDPELAVSSVGLGATLIAWIWAIHKAGKQKWTHEEAYAKLRAELLERSINDYKVLKNDKLPEFIKGGPVVRFIVEKADTKERAKITIFRDGETYMINADRFVE